MRRIHISQRITNKEGVSLDKYLNEISHESLITEEEEVVLAKKIKNGDKTALDKLTKANLRFVISVAKQYQYQGLDLPDLINEGNLGLIKACQRFDETRGFKFVSFAVWWIRQSILLALSDDSRLVRLPLNKIGSINVVTKTFSRLEQQLERNPSTWEISEILEIPEKRVIETVKIKDRHVSMDAPLSTDPDDVKNMYDSIPDSGSSPDSSLMKESLKREIKLTLKTLRDPRESNIIALYFGLGGEGPMSIKEIANLYEKNETTIRTIKERAIEHLKVSYRSEPLRKYLG